MNMGDAPQEAVISGEIIDRLASCSLGLGSVKFWTDRADTACRYLILKIENVCNIAIEAIGPNMGPGLAVNELAGNAHLACRLAHAAFQHVPHAQVTAHLLYVHR